MRPGTQFLAVAIAFAVTIGTGTVLYVSGGLDRFVDEDLCIEAATWHLEQVGQGNETWHYEAAQTYLLLNAAGETCSDWRPGHA